MTATVKSMPSPVRNHPSRTVPSAHSTRACPQNDGRGRPWLCVGIRRTPMLPEGLEGITRLHALGRAP